jgi:hypothetical protein
MAAACALCASGLLRPSLHLPPFQADTASATKFVFRTILSPTEGTKHESPFYSFDYRWHTSPKNSSSVI